MTAPLVWDSSKDAPISWFVGWLRKATICASESGEDRVPTDVFTDEEINKLFELWLDGYSEDAAAETVKRHESV
jgi:hypothetical protein